MTKVVIEAENLGKAYRIGKKEERHETLVSSMWHALKSPINNFLALRDLKNLSKHEETVFWALRDLSFTVREGEVLGIIGHNGAGKSTLLKIISCITEPTEGRVTIRGRISSLLEVGTGFHPDLTGRENIYMNGTILGMRKKEIDAKLDEIISFSGVSKHIDTPVKRYSSGMTVRLAFSVAAHLDPEILIIDEVLSVGDAEFQKKCLGKMRDVSLSGRTVLFVSHVLPAVKSLCSRALVLKSGQKDFEGPVDMAIDHYLGTSKTESNWVYKSTGEDVSLENFEIKVDGLETNRAYSGAKVQFYFMMDIKHPINFPLSVSIQLSVNGVLVSNLWTDYFQPLVVREGKQTICCTVDRWPFREGIITIDTYIHTSTIVQDFIENLGVVETVDNSYYKLNGTINRNSRGLVFVDHTWQLVS